MLFHACYAVGTAARWLNRPFDPTLMGFLNLNEDFSSFFVEIFGHSRLHERLPAYLTGETDLFGNQQVFYHDVPFWNAFVAKRCLQCAKE
jgi:hypothetical protein